jgi:DNA replication protein DnaC
MVHGQYGLTSPGTGKSFLAQAIGYLAIKQGLLVLYRSIFDVVRDFLHDEAVEGQEKVLAGYLKPDLLIVDDMGMKQLPKRSGEYLFEIIMRRYETRSTMITSNRPLEDSPTVKSLAIEQACKLILLDRRERVAQQDNAKNHRQESHGASSVTLGPARRTVLAMGGRVNWAQSIPWRPIRRRPYRRT